MSQPSVPSGTQLMNQIGFETLRAIRNHQSVSPTAIAAVTKHDSTIDVPQLSLPPTLVWTTQRVVVWKSIESFLHKRGLKENISLIQSIFDHVYNQCSREDDTKRSEDTNDYDDGQGWGWIMEHPECMEEHKQIKCQCPFFHESQRQQLFSSASLYASHPWTIFHYLSDWKVSNSVLQALAFNISTLPGAYHWSRWPGYGLREQPVVIITLTHEDKLPKPIESILNEVKSTKNEDDTYYIVVIETLTHHRKAWISVRKYKGKWVRHGLHTTWYEDTNQIRSCFCYQNGQRYGLGQRWNRNGTYSHFTHVNSVWPSSPPFVDWDDSIEATIENIVVFKTTIDEKDNTLEHETQWVHAKDVEIPIVKVNKRLPHRSIESKESWKLCPDTYEPSSCLLYEYYPITQRVHKISSWKCQMGTCLRHGHEETFNSDGSTEEASGWMMDERIY